MNSLTLEIQNGNWQINEKPLTNCSIEKQQIFENHLRMKKFKAEIIERETHTFHNRKEEIKKMNYQFKTLHQDYLEEHPNIENLEFIKLTNSLKTETL